MGFWIFLFCSKRTQLFRKLLCHALCASYVFNIDKVHCIASYINKKEMLKKTYFCSLCFSRGKSLTPTGQSAMLHIEKKKKTALVLPNVLPDKNNQSSYFRQ